MAPEGTNRLVKIAIGTASASNSADSHFTCQGDPWKACCQAYWLGRQMRAGRGCVPNKWLLCDTRSEQITATSCKAHRQTCPHPTRLLLRPSNHREYRSSAMALR